MDDFFYRKLNVYQQALQQVRKVYALVRKFPPDERYILADQIRRAVISVPSNIAEGMGRNSIKERLRFLEIASGSLKETMCQLEIAHTLAYISDEELRASETDMVNISRQLVGLKKSLEEKLNNQQ